ncbi:MAG: glycosyltransferase [Planctomycetes bacterium]|nr:glycosyltransferase [Planctomycetota bacterium]
MTQNGAVHIVVITDVFFETNGVATYYKTLLNWSRRNGRMRVTVLCPARDDLIVGKIPDNVIPIRGAIQFRNPFYRDLTLGYFPQRKLRTILRELSGPKVVHIATSGPLGYAGSAAARRLKLPLVGCYNTDMRHYGGIYGQSLAGSPGKWLGNRAGLTCDKLAYGRCQAMYVPSATAYDSAREFFRGDIEVIPHPVDVERFRPAPNRSGDFKSQYCPNGAVLVAAVGRVAKEKNLDRMCELLGGDKRIKLVLVGDGPYSDSLRARWNVPITGFLGGKELIDAFQQADVFVQLSRTETYGLALIESMACGLPAVVLKGNGLANMLPPDSGVDLLEEEDLPTLADRCVALVADVKRHREQARRAREFALTLGPDVAIPKFEAFHRRFAR